MTTELIRCTRSLTGVVIETFEQDGKSIAKVTLKSCHIDIPLDAIPDAHLGDIVVLEAEISVQGVKTHPHE